MASSASTGSVVKAGYWIFGSDFNRPVADHIPSELFTYLYAGFATVNDNDGTVTVPEQYLDQFRTFPKRVRERNSKVKTLLSIGGEGSPISPVVEDADKRQTFITTSIDLARNFGFDGLDLCWLYPSNADQEDLLSDFLYEWRPALDEEFKKTEPIILVSGVSPLQLLLTAAVFHHPVIPGGDGNNDFYYPCQAISDNLDWINVLAIDFYTPSNSPDETGPVHAWRNPREQNKCGSEGIYNWINRIPNPVKIDTQKLVLGLPFYGYKWTLKNSHQHDFFADATNPPNPAAPLAFRNIQADYININAGRLVDDHDMFVASYWHHEVTWIGFEDEHSIATKVKEVIRGNNLGGYLAWHLEADDYKWTLSKATSSGWDNAINNPGTTTTTTTTTTNITTTDAAAASGEGDINNDPQNSDQNTSTSTSTTTTTTTTTTSAATTTSTATATSTSSVNICNIL